jgi:RND superfamily putative drug exporter
VFEKLGKFIVKRSKVVLLTFIITTIIAGAVGSLSFGRLDSGGYSDLNSDSAKAAKYVVDVFGAEEPVVVMVVDSASSTIDDPAVASTAIEIEKKIQNHEVCQRLIPTGRLVDH